MNLHDVAAFANLIIIILVACILAAAFLIWRIIVHQNELRQMSRYIDGVYYDDKLRLYTSTYNDCLISFRSKKNNDIDHIGLIAERSGLYNIYEPGNIYFYDRKLKKLYVSTECPKTHNILNFEFVRETRDGNGRLALVKLGRGRELSFSYDHMIA